jgi:hypothetical protein
VSGVSSPPLLPPPGWYPDPGGSAALRWWDGQRWTEHLHAAGTAPGPAATAPVAVTTPSRYRQKWWHIPLLVGIGVASTAASILLQFWR